VLHKLGELNFMLRRFKDVDEPSRKKLEEIAIAKRFSQRERYASIEEAALDGVSAARILIVLKALQDEETRQENVRDAERRKREAEADLARARRA
jgi:hypothetical protein